MKKRSMVALAAIIMIILVACESDNIEMPIETTPFGGHREEISGQNFVGEINGVRIPVEQLYFQQQLVTERLGFDAWMMTETEIYEIAFQALVDAYIVAGLADEFGVVMTPEQISLAHDFADAFREGFRWDGIDQIAGMGFTHASFNSFIELLVLGDAVRIAISESIERPSDEELYEAFAEFLLVNREHHYIPYVWLVEVNSRQGAESLLERMAAGESIEELILEIHGTGGLNAVQSRNIFSYRITQPTLDAARIAEAHTLIDEVFEMWNGNYAIFVLDRLEYDPPSFEEWEDWHIADLGWEYFDNRLALARAQAEISKNPRFFN